MANYTIKVDNLKQNGDYAELIATLESDEELYFPRISACFFAGNDNRILPMDLKECNGNTAQVIGIFDIPFLFYNKPMQKEIKLGFLVSDGNADNVMVFPDKEIIINAMKKNELRHFLKENRRERQKFLFSKAVQLLYLPYKRMKVKPNKVLFLSNRSDRLTGNIKAVFHEMTKLEGVDITVLCKKGGIKASLPVMFTFFKEYATSSVVFVDDYYHFLTFVKKKDDVTLIQLWHACGAFKTFGFSRLGRDSYLRQSSSNHRQYDYVIVSSKDIVPYYAEGFGVATSKVVPLGSPRCDALENEQYKRFFIRKFRKEHPELDGKRIMLFAPTFRGGGMGSCYYPIERFDIDRLLDSVDDDWVVIVKMHPYLSERPSYSPRHEGRVFDYTSHYDINDLLFVTDLLVTDYSSVIFEASVVGVPMLFYAFDLSEYSRDRDFYCNFSSFVPGRIVLSMDEMVSAIRNSDYKAELIEPFRHKYFDDTNGRATENVINFTKELLK